MTTMVKHLAQIALDKRSESEDVRCAAYCRETLALNHLNKHLPRQLVELVRVEQQVSETDHRLSIIVDFCAPGSGWEAYRVVVTPCLLHPYELRIIPAGAPHADLLAAALTEQLDKEV